MGLLEVQKLSDSKIIFAMRKKEDLIFTDFSVGYFHRFFLGLYQDGFYEEEFIKGPSRDLK